ncbi:MAG: hypothetical protein DMD99_19985 [Candidatus Rokuibacteriota bacterium]|nr:MAG: hypothetical protein DMD99_19985 [Candidatus Rokubacteria bacterium]
MKLSVESLTKGLQFHGEVQGKRQHYYVLSSPRQYFVMSISLSKRDAGNFNLVSRAAVDGLYRRLRGQRGLTARLVFDRSRKGRLVVSSLAALNMLYVLVATGRAGIDAKRKSPQIFFNVRRRPEAEA